MSVASFDLNLDANGACARGRAQAGADAAKNLAHVGAVVSSMSGRKRRARPVHRRARHRRPYVLCGLAFSRRFVSHSARDRHFPVRSFWERLTFC